MFYLFTGSDTERVRTKAFEWVAAAKAKEPSVVYRRLAREDLSLAVLEECAASGGLFVNRLLILLDDPFAKSEDEESSSLVEDALELIEASNNVFVILAPKLHAAKVKKIGAKAKKMYTFDEWVAKEGRGFNSALVNALGERSRERLWLELTRALRAGDAPEMLHGLLHWKARDLMEKGARRWSPKEAHALSLTLLALLQESRRGGLPLSLALERFSLSL